MKRTLHEWIFHHLASRWHAAQLEAISFFCSAVIDARSLVIAKVGHAGANDTGILPRHGIKRSNRLLKNEHFTREQMNESSIDNFIRYIRHRKSIALVIDWTQKNLFMLLSISLATDDGRTVPIVWDGYLKGALGECDSQNKIEEELLTKVLMSLPHRMKVLVLGDRGFHRPEFLKFIRSFGKNVDFIIRVPAGDFILAKGKEILLDDTIVAKGGSKNFGTVLYTKERRLPARCVAVWDEQSREPWILLTSLKNVASRTIAELYAQRMSIEAMFKSMKNEVSGLSLKKARLRHIERWLVLCFLATVLLQYFWEISQSMTQEDREYLDCMFTLARHRRRYGRRKYSYSIYYLMLLVALRDEVSMELRRDRILISVKRH
jgi:hypothetical protein